MIQSGIKSCLKNLQRLFQTLSSIFISCHLKFLGHFFLYIKHKQTTEHTLSQGDETGSVGGTNTGSAVSGGGVGDRELTKVVTNHLRLDLDKEELLAVVDTEGRANHLRNNDHVSEVGLDRSRLLVTSSLLGSTELLDQTHGLLVKTTVQSSASTSMDDFTETLDIELKKVGEVNTTVGELLENSLLALFCKKS